MKRKILILMMGLFFSGIAFSQNSVGIATGINIAGISTKGIGTGEFSSLENYAFATFGILYKRDLDEHWSIIPGLNYSRRGAQTVYSDGITIFDHTYDIGAKLVHKMNYLEIPVLFQYTFNKDKNVFSPYIFAGPQFSYESSYDIDVKAHFIIDFNIFSYGVDLSNKIFNRYDLSAVAGAGFSLPVKKGTVNIDARYVYGFSDILDNPLLDFNLKHRNIRLGIAYYYGF